MTLGTFLIGLAVGVVGALLVMAIIRGSKGPPTLEVPAPSAAPPPRVTSGGEATHEVVLIDAGRNKIEVIKVLRECVPGMGLKHAKDLTDQAPQTIGPFVSAAEGERMQRALQAAGATVEVRAVA